MKFTWEDIKDNRWAFSISTVHVTEDKSLDAVVYRKPTHTVISIHFIGKTKQLLGKSIAQWKRAGSSDKYSACDDGKVFTLIG